MDCKDSLSPVQVRKMTRNNCYSVTNHKGSQELFIVKKSHYLLFYVFIYTLLANLFIAVVFPFELRCSINANISKCHNVLKVANG